MAPSIWQILLIVLVVLLIFGAGKIPQIMGDMAKGFKSFKKGLEDDDSSDAKKEATKNITHEKSNADSTQASENTTKDKA